MGNNFHNEKNVLYLTKFKTRGIKGFENSFGEIDLSPEKTREYPDNVEFWGLKRSKQKFGALKAHIFLGENGTYKSSILEAIFLFYKFIKNPTENFNHYSIKSNTIEWESELVTKIDNWIYKFYWEIEINFINNFNSQTREIKKEKLSFIKTKDGKTITNKKIIYQVKNNYLIQPIDDNAPKYVFNNSNGFESIFIMSKNFPDNSETQNIFSHLMKSMNSSISRDDITTQQFSLPTNIINKRQQEIILKIYKLFDKNINGTTMKPRTNELLIEYKINESKIKYITINEFLQIASSGASRILELIRPMYEAISDKRNYCFIFDEIEKSLHPTLANFIVDLLLYGHKGQLFFATHNPELTKRSFRKDQIHLFIEENYKLYIHKGTDIAPTKNHQFKNEFTNVEYLSNPKQKIREELFDLIDNEK